MFDYSPPLKPWNVLGTLVFIMAASMITGSSGALLIVTTAMHSSAGWAYAADMELEEQLPPDLEQSDPSIDDVPTADLEPSQIEIGQPPPADFEPSEPSIDDTPSADFEPSEPEVEEPEE